MKRLTKIALRPVSSLKLAPAVSLTLLLCLGACERVEPERDNPSTDMTSGLVGRWTFDEGTGTTVADASGFGHRATIRNGSFGRGRHGGGLQMDGGDDGIVVIPASEHLKSTAGSITVMAWTYRTAEHNVAVLAHDYPAVFFGFHGPQFKWQITGRGGAMQRAVGKIDLVRRVAARLGYRPTARAACYIDPSDPDVLNRWIHLAATFDGSIARLYVDGREVCSEPLEGEILMTDAPFTISGYLDAAGEIVDEITGTLDDVRIYNRVLSEEDIRSVYLLTPSASPDPIERAREP